ncbi:MAG: response regulator [Burkholderiales bacterium]|nr:response regulator [Burkholderiales bacterium]
MFKGFVVEDNLDATGTLVEALAELAGVTTVGSAAGEEAAIAWLTNPDNDWNVAIIDLQLGANGSGYRVVAALADRLPHQKVIVWTASADAMARTRCRVLGCDRVFDRATEISELMEYCMVESEAGVLRIPVAAPAYTEPAGESSRPQPRFGITTNLVAS